ncbi:hypothetical protein VJ923_00220 [Adlercreutzia sp. R25]|uniref:DUF4179 domain-containing protein n=1 Tax=Adlercreutzia shanghongiae TaxID=3111773 RepID=A0ABU6J1U2_9ACTN|nr:MULTISPECIES: hypothetical protein [unclassified Adlercreutzia]MEC4271584.1 hypothetical protein [Adlercreutzia sp. R25]MEC4295777.1 hypothetical protein [Adlercreutzia sp. R22]
MNISRYIQAMKDIEAPPDLADRTISLILENDPEKHVAPKGGHNASRARSTFRVKMHFAAKIAACLLLTVCVLGSVLAIPSLPTIADAFAPKHSAEHLRLTSGPIYQVDEDIILALHAHLNLPSSSEGMGKRILSFDSPSIELALPSLKADVPYYQDASRHLTIRNPSSSIDFIILIRLSSLDEATYRDMIETDYERDSYRIYKEMELTVDQLETASLTVEEAGASSKCYALDIDQLKGQWDFSSSLFHGGPLTINLVPCATN